MFDFGDSPAPSENSSSVVSASAGGQAGKPGNPIFSRIGGALVESALPALVELLVGRWRPMSKVEEAEELEATLRIEQLRDRLEQRRVVEVPLQALAGMLPRLTVVLGDQHTGKSTCMANFAHLTQPGCDLRWCQPMTTTKAIHLPAWATVDDAPGLHPNSHVFLDESWEWYQSDKKNDDKWLRQLYHHNTYVMMASQSGQFLKPNIWRSGDVAIIHTGNSQAISKRFEREEIAELSDLLGSIAEPQRKAAALINGVTYAFEYFDSHAWGGGAASVEEQQG